MANTPKDWNNLAARLDDLSRDMIDQSEFAGNEFDRQIIVLWARSLSHSAIEMRFLATEGEA
jgi:hypothetical protein